MKVAIVHDWLVNYGGAETWVELALTMYPDADIYTLVHDPKKLGNHFKNNKIFTSYIQKLPMASKLYTKLLSFMPKAFESFDLTDYDLVICSSSCCAKGVITKPSTPCVAYIHSPMRYAWDLYFDYRKRSGRLTKFFMDLWMQKLRLWDYVSSHRLDAVVANSKYIARRIKKFWDIDAKVVYSPVNTERFYADEATIDAPKEDYYVAFSRLVQYKRADLAVSACKALGKKLVVIGDGNERENLEKLAGEENGKSIIFAGRLSDEEVRSHLRKCKALIFSAEEDFGLTPLEAQCCGSPVIAFGKGGATETVVDGVTGVFFPKQETESVVEAIKNFEKISEENPKAFNPREISAHAKTFSRERFVKEFQAVIDEAFEKVEIK